MNEKEKNELALSKIVLIVLAIIGVAVVVWLAWAHPSANKNAGDGDISSFAQCTKAGNPVQSSYPETCVTQDGKHFTNPNQNIQRLSVKEWKADVLVNGVSDAYYTYDDATQMVTLSTKTLDKVLNRIQGCASGLHEIQYEQLQPGDATPAGDAWTAEQLTKEAKHVGDYYYRVVQQIETACVPANDDPNVKTAKTIHDALSAATFLPQ